MGYVVEKQNILTFLSIFSLFLQQQGVQGLNPVKALDTLIKYYES